MSILLLLILFGLVVYLSSKVRRASEQLERLEQRLEQLERQLTYQERRSARSPGEQFADVANVSDLRPEELAPSAEVAMPPLVAEVESRLPPTPEMEIREEAAIPPVLGQDPAWAGRESIPPFTPSSSTAAEPTPLSFEQPSAPSRLQINWEQFMGVKLFAWIGGFALFLGVAFFIKYSFERNLIPPGVRVALGFAVGLGLLVGGIWMKRRELAVTSHTLCATGIVILYAVSFACRSVYHFAFFGPGVTFALMVLITFAAFVLAVQLDALAVAILGIAGGFLTPILLSTGTDNPVGLFTYIALLDAGLIAVAFRRRWDFLVLLGAAGTLLTEIGWAAEFFQPAKVFIAMAVFLGFDILFCVAFQLSEKKRETTDWLAGSAVGLQFATLGFTLFLLSFASLGPRPGVLFTFALGADLCLMAMVLARPALHPVHIMAGGAAFLLLAAWTGQYLSSSLLYWALGLYFGFAVLHTGFPLVLQRFRPDARVSPWSHLFPSLALLLVLISLLRIQPVSLAVWPVVLLIDALAIAAATLAGSALSILAVLLLTGLATALWMTLLPANDLSNLTDLLIIIGGFALFFFAATLFVGPKILAKLGRADVEAGDGTAPWKRHLTEAEVSAQIPALSAILPFMLLMMISARLPLANPSPVFGLAMVLTFALLGLALFTGVDALVPVGLVCGLALEYTWYEEHFDRGSPWVPLAWATLFYLVYTLFPFVFRARLRARILPWVVSALAGPLHFYLAHRMVSEAFHNPVPGLLPAALAIPMLVAMSRAARLWPREDRMRLNLLAWFGGSALFFITLIFPIQFERQWITIGWALEGLALIWLFHRVPHPGLRATGVVLLAVSFVRLALNPAVLEYHPVSTVRVFNWYLYAYGLVTIYLMVSARLLAPPRNRVWGRNMQPVLYTLGTILAFLLVNIEIADYFSEGPALTFQFSGSLARDMSYSVAWALFSLVLLIAGIWKRQTATRYAALGLMSVTLVKLFLHDLSQLGQLYRIGAFVVVAVILILASFLYQRFVSFDASRRA